MYAYGPLGAALVMLTLTGPALAQPRPTTRSSDNPPVTRPLEPVPATVSEVGGKNLTQWRAELKNQDASRRVDAIRAVILFGAGASDCVPLLIDRTQDHDASPRVKAVIALRLVPVRARDVPKVVEALARRISPYDETQAIVRYEALVTLGRFAADARPAITALVRAADDRTCWEARQLAVSILRRAGFDPKGPDPRATRALLGALRDSTSGVRLEATIGLGSMGRPADASVRAQVLRGLQNQLTSRDRVLALWSQVSLMSLDKVTAAGLGVVVKELKHPDPQVRLQAIQALAAMGPYAKACYPNLIDTLQDKDASAVVAACSALVSIGAGNARVLDALKELSERKDAGDSAKVAAKVALQVFKKAKEAKEAPPEPPARKPR